MQGKPRMAGSLRSRAVKRLLPNLSNGGAVVAGAAPEFFSRMASGQGIIQAGLGTAVSEMAQAYGGDLVSNFARNSPLATKTANLIGRNGGLSGPVDPNVLRRAGDVIGNVVGYGAAQLGENILSGILSPEQAAAAIPPPTPMPIDAAAASGQTMTALQSGAPANAGTAAAPGPVPLLNEEQVQRARDYELRKAALSAYFAQQLDQYPTG